MNEREALKRMILLLVLSLADCDCHQVPDWDGSMKQMEVRR